MSKRSDKPPASRTENSNRRPKAGAATEQARRHAQGAKPQAAGAGRSDAHGRTAPEVVSGRWLVRALGLTLVFAILCAYLTLCLLFYQGQWQLLFHPSRSITTTPATLGLGFDDIRFNTTETGMPQLDGWWIPAGSTDARAGAGSNPLTANPSQSPTILFLHGASGSLSDIADQLKTLHGLGIHLFAIDYRGFGQSANAHPSEARVYQDADAAWSYLTVTRHLDPHSIVLYGQGLGATIAAETARRHPESPALILDNPSPPALTLIHADTRTGILPVRLLFRDRFNLVPILASLGYVPDPPARRLLEGQRVQEKLVVIEYTPQHTFQNAGHTAILSLFSEQAAYTDPHYVESIHRFLDESIPQRPQ